MILFRKIANVSLALVLLIATTGVTLNKHYCMGRLKSVAVFQEAHSCAENGEKDPMPCCKDVSEHMKVEEVTQVTFDFKGAHDLFQVAIVSFLALEQDFLLLEVQHQKHYDYPPPLPDQDLIILNQTFLI